MKWLVGILVALLLLAIGAAAVEHLQLDGYRKAARAAADSLATARQEAAALDSAQASQHRADSLQHARDAVHVAARRDTTDRTARHVVALQDSVTRLGDSLAKVDSTPLFRAFRAVAFRLRDTTGKLMVALLNERAAADRLAVEDAATIAGLVQDNVDIRRQRDDALTRAQGAIAGEIEAQHRWPAWRRIITAGSCGLAGAAAITKKLAVAGGAGAVCGISLALP